jgi:hypothetical protein
VVAVACPYSSITYLALPSGYSHISPSLTAMAECADGVVVKIKADELIGFFKPGVIDVLIIEVSCHTS